MKEKFINKVLEILNKRHKTDFKYIHRDNIPDETFIIEAKIKGRNIVHVFDADISNKIDYKTIKKYAKALIEIVKQDLIRV